MHGQSVIFFRVLRVAQNESNENQLTIRSTNQPKKHTHNIMYFIARCSLVGSRSCSRTLHSCVGIEIRLCLWFFFFSFYLISFRCICRSRNIQIHFIFFFSFWLFFYFVCILTALHIQYPKTEMKWNTKWTTAITTTKKEEKPVQFNGVACSSFLVCLFSSFRLSLYIYFILFFFFHFVCIYLSSISIP